jgi:hypothetical protein
MQGTLPRRAGKAIVCGPSEWFPAESGCEERSQPPLMVCSGHRFKKAF